MTLEEIKQALADRNLTVVSEAVGLNPHTLYRIVHGKTNPHRSTIAMLRAYLTNGAASK